MSKASIQSDVQARRFARGLSARIAAAATVTLASGVWSATAARAATILAEADAEIRETQPERTRGFGDPAASGQQAELQISTTTGTPNRNLALIRFQLPPEITTPADIEGFVDVRIYNRANFNIGGSGSSVRLYGIDPTNPLAGSWDEQTVMYRDTGSHQLNSPEIGTGQNNLTPSVIAQPSPGTVTVADPVAPVAGAAGYGADPNHPRRSPGIRYEDAPFSGQVQNENAARLTYNQNQRTAYLADLDDDGIVQGTYGYLPYINQPGYNVNTTTTVAVTNALTTGDGDPGTPDGYTDIYSDVPVTNRPFFSGATGTWLDDLDASATYLALATLPGGSRVAGEFLSFTAEDGYDNTDGAQRAANLQALVDWISAGLTAGHSEFTFILGPGVGVGGDLVNTVNMQFASKDLIPAGGAAGDYGPRMIVAPEPGSMMLAGVAALGLLRRGRRAR